MDRVAITEESKNKRKQLQGNNLVYRNKPPQIQRKLDTSRASERKRWMDFSAGILLERKLFDELIKKGHVPIPTQWIETDQN
eukprot:4978223-Karenia_brevis.AAC.1